MSQTLSRAGKIDAGRGLEISEWGDRTKKRPSVHGLNFSESEKPPGAQGGSWGTAEGAETEHYEPGLFELHAARLKQRGLACAVLGKGRDGL